ncbi:MAG: metallophosphoesterase [Planctomycetes bacterium]|nr:metallophosphoesterase [Planctomycetota bacterium]
MPSLPDPAKTPPTGGAHEQSLGRRAFLQWSLGAAAAAAVGTAGYAFGVGPWHLEVTFPEIAIPGLAPALDGLRIVHLTDLHPNSHIPLEYLERCMEAANECRPDLVLATGDYVTYGKDDLDIAVTALARLRAPLGKFSCLGNHDYHFGHRRTIELLRRTAGFEVLVNENTLVHPRGSPLRLIGLDDLWFGNLDLRRGLAGTSPKEPRIVLLHNPDYLERLAPAGVDLVLSGHTHGGQISLPLVGAPILPSRYEGRYVNGLYRSGGTQLYVNRGLGIGYIPARLLARPEVACITLRSA